MWDYNGNILTSICFLCQVFFSVRVSVWANVTFSTLSQVCWMSNESNSKSVRIYDSTCFCSDSRPMSCNTHSKDKAHWSFSEYIGLEIYILWEKIFRNRISWIKYEWSFNSMFVAIQLCTILCPNSSKLNILAWDLFWTNMVIKRSPDITYEFFWIWHFL